MMILACIALVFSLLAAAGSIYTLRISYLKAKTVVENSDNITILANKTNDFIKAYNEAIEKYNGNFIAYYDALKNVEICLISLDQRVTAGNVSEATLKEFISIYNKEVALADAEVDKLLDLSERKPNKGEMN